MRCSPHYIGSPGGVVREVDAVQLVWSVYDIRLVVGNNCHENRQYSFLAPCPVSTILSSNSYVHT